MGKPLGGKVFRDYNTGHDPAGAEHTGSCSPRRLNTPKDARHPGGQWGFGMAGLSRFPPFSVQAGCNDGQMPSLCHCSVPTSPSRY